MSKKTILTTEESKKYRVFFKNIRNKINYEVDVKDLPEIKSIKDKKPNEVKEFITDSLLYIGEYMSKNSSFDSVAFSTLSILLRKNLNYTENEWMEMMTLVRQVVLKVNLRLEDTYWDLNYIRFPMNFMVKQLENHLKKNKPSEKLKKFISEMLKWKHLKRAHSDDAKKIAQIVQRLSVISHTGSDETSEETIFYFKLKDKTFGDAINKAIKSCGIYKQKGFHNILILANSVSGSKPTKKFLSSFDENLKAIGKEKYREAVHSILSVLSKTPKKTYYQFYDAPIARQFFGGLVLTTIPFSDQKTTQLLGEIMLKSYHKACAMGIGNSCTYVLGNMRGKDGLGVLARVKKQIKQASTLKKIDQFLAEGAEKYGVSMQELEDMSVPNFNLVNGEKTVLFNDYKFHIAIDGSKVVQQWIKPDGKTIKSVPSEVRKVANLKDKLKEVRQEVKEIQKNISAQKLRFDNLFLSERTWDFQTFNTYFLSHGLVSAITKSLIFTIEKDDKSTTAIFHNGQWKNTSEKVLSWVDETCLFKLWHPIFSSENEIVAWRDFIINNEIKQVIKQAFREIYILTDAERTTKKFSNRMASHILKQHQFSTLAEMRDWKFIKHGYIDNGCGDASKYLEKYNITASYGINGIHDEYAELFMQYVQTHELSFFDENGQMKLEDVPKIVFSEIMRDADLFVGVCSVGNEPEWQDNDYWQSHSFGDLSEIAKTRKVILKRLLPKLKIAKKLHIDGKFLVVKGNLRTYKIHIGSGNILMEPNNQYLCIVPSVKPETTTDKLFVPFEGDRGLSIVLSKAFLLAEDTKIKDSTITSQINRK